jgi:hypothetical protein
MVSARGRRSGCDQLIAPDAECLRPVRGRCDPRRRGAPWTRCELVSGFFRRKSRDDEPSPASATRSTSFNGSVRPLPRQVGFSLMKRSSRATANLGVPGGSPRTSNPRRNRARRDQERVRPRGAAISSTGDGRQRTEGASVHRACFATSFDRITTGTRRLASASASSRSARPEISAPPARAERRRSECVPAAIRSFRSNRAAKKRERTRGFPRSPRPPRARDWRNSAALARNDPGARRGSKAVIRGRRLARTLAEELGQGRARPRRSPTKRARPARGARRSGFVASIAA